MVRLACSMIALLMIISLTGCAATPSNYAAKYHTKAESIALYESNEKPKGNFEFIKFIQSNSCDSKTFGRFAGNWDEAKLLLRLEAAMVNADAITDYKCWTNAVDMVSNCWASKRCEGNAIRSVEK